uniref:Uncharacterized protein n=1 Tax=Arundo donax TaxID=35708 RepID=A0A0A9BKD3_ARUDO
MKPPPPRWCSRSPARLLSGLAPWSFRGWPPRWPASPTLSAPPATIWRRPPRRCLARTTRRDSRPSSRWARRPPLWSTRRPLDRAFSAAQWRVCRARAGSAAGPALQEFFT